MRSAQGEQTLPRAQDMPSVLDGQMITQPRQNVVPAPTGDAAARSIITGGQPPQERQVHSEAIQQLLNRQHHELQLQANALAEAQSLGADGVNAPVGMVSNPHSLQGSSPLTLEELMSQISTPQSVFNPQGGF